MFSQFRYGGLFPFPFSPSKTLDKGCFIDNTEQDVYYCPQGKATPYEETQSQTQRGRKVIRRSYRCHECAGCPLAAKCISSRNNGGRTVSRDIYASGRERHAAKMDRPESRAVYDRRMHIAETPFALIKHVLGLRQFLLRGLETVNIGFSNGATARRASLHNPQWRSIRQTRKILRIPREPKRFRDGSG
ncbi:MAG: transposase [Planctomycetales bacterium]